MAALSAAPELPQLSLDDAPELTLLVARALAEKATRQRRERGLSVNLGRVALQCDGVRLATRPVALSGGEGTRLLWAPPLEGDGEVGRVPPPRVIH